MYFIQHPDNRLIKIGKTSRFAVRIRQLEFEFGTSFAVLGVLMEDQYSEKHLHHLFRRLREIREFFLPDPALLDFIQKNAVPWDPSMDLPGGETAVKVDRFVKWQLSEIARERGVSVERLVDELLRGPAARLHAEIRPGSART